MNCIGARQIFNQCAKFHLELFGIIPIAMLLSQRNFRILLVMLFSFRQYHIVLPWMVSRWQQLSFDWTKLNIFISINIAFDQGSYNTQSGDQNANVMTEAKLMGNSTKPSKIWQLSLAKNECFSTFCARGRSQKTARRRRRVLTAQLLLVPAAVTVSPGRAVLQGPCDAPALNFHIC